MRELTASTIGAWLESSRRPYMRHPLVWACRRLQKLLEMRERRICSLVLRGSWFDGHVRFGRRVLRFGIHLVGQGIVRVELKACCRGAGEKRD